MARAYVAKPEADTSPSLPPGWGVVWPFPGPNPPGYTPDYSLELTIPSGITVAGHMIEVRAELVDNLVFAVSEPAAGTTIIWYALIGDEVIGLSETDGDYASTVTKAYSEITGSTYGFQSYGNKFDLYFNIDASHENETITLYAYTVVEEQVMNENEEVAVSAPHIIATITVTKSGSASGGADWSMDWNLRAENYWLYPDAGSIVCDLDESDNSNEWNFYSATKSFAEPDGSTLTSGPPSGIAEVKGFEAAYLYEIYLWHSGSTDVGENINQTFNIELSISVDGASPDVYNLQHNLIVGEDDSDSVSGQWLTINGDTGAVSVTGPPT